MMRINSSIMILLRQKIVYAGQGLINNCQREKDSFLMIARSCLHLPAKHPIRPCAIHQNNRQQKHRAYH